MTLYRRGCMGWFGLGRMACAGLALGILMTSMVWLGGCATTDVRMQEIRQRRYSVDQFNLGEKYERDDNLPMAINHYHKSLNASPRPVTYYKLGHIYAEQGEYLQAQSFLEKAVEDNPHYDLARLELEKVNLILAEREAAAAASGVAPDAVARSSDDIISEFREIDIPSPLPPVTEVSQRLFPGLTDPDSDAARAEERRLYSYVTSHKIAMPSAEYHRRKAEEFALRGLLDEAIKEYHDTLEFAPGDMEARLGLARVYERAGRMKAAEEELLRTVEMFPESSTAAFNTGNFYFRQELHERAREFFLRAIDLQPDYRPALNNLAASQIKLGEYQAAQLTLERLLDNDPRFLNAHLNLGILFDDHLADPEKALYHYRRYLELGGTNRDRVEQWISDLEAARTNP